MSIESKERARALEKTARVREIAQLAGAYEPIEACVKLMSQSTEVEQNMYQQGGTIKDALDRIASNEFVLPAIQREFVWRPEQICQLFDSVMQGYPFGDFLFWKIEPERSADYRYYGFVRDYTPA